MAARIQVAANAVLEGITEAHTQDALMEPFPQDEQLAEHIDNTVSLLKDSDPKVCFAALTALRSTLQSNAGRCKKHLRAALPILTDRLGSSGAVQTATVLTVVDSAAELSAAAVLEKLQGVWRKTHWRQKVGCIRAVLAISLKYSLEPEDLQRMVLQPLSEQLEDVDSRVREAAAEALMQMHGKYPDKVEAAVNSSIASSTQLQLLKVRLYGLDETQIAQLQEAKEKAEASVLLQAVTAALPAAASEKAARAKAERLLASLGTDVDWSKRSEALAELDAWVKDGFCLLPFFPELLRALLEPLRAQIADRRSAVSKQACRFLASLAEAMGTKFELQALMFMPELFKVLVISIQVMAEAADVCIGTIMLHCHSQKLLLLICSTLCVDRNAKLRMHCASYLLQALEVWQPWEYEMALDAVEKAAASACQDALSETRATAKKIFGVFSSTWPDHVQHLLGRLQPTAQARMRKAIAEHGTSGQLENDAASKCALSAQTPVLFRSASSFLTSPGLPQPGSAFQTSPRQIRQLPSAAASPASAMQGFKIPGSVPRGRAGALRVSAPDLPAKHHVLRQQSLASSLTFERTEQSLGACGVGRRASENEARAANQAVPEAWQTPVHRRMSAPGSPEMLRPPKGAQQWGSSAYTAKTYGRRPLQEPASGSIAAKWPAARQRSSNAGSSSYSRVSSRQQSLSSTPSISRAQSGSFGGPELPDIRVLVSKMKCGLTKWQEKLDVVRDVAIIADQAPQTLDVVAYGDALTDTLAALSGDAHNKVACAAIELVTALQEALPHFWRGHRMLQIAPALLMRSADTREAVKKAAAQATQKLAESSGLPAVLPGLCKTLHSTKVPRIICATLSCFCEMVFRGEAPSVADASSIRMWEKQLSGLAKDKNAEIRQAADQALGLVKGPALGTFVDKDLMVRGDAALAIFKEQHEEDRVDVRSSFVGLQSHPVGLMSGYQTSASASDSDASPDLSPAVQSPAKSAFTVAASDSILPSALPDSLRIEDARNGGRVGNADAEIPVPGQQAKAAGSMPSSNNPSCRLEKLEAEAPADESLVWKPAAGKSQSYELLASSSTLVEDAAALLEPFSEKQEISALSDQVTVAPESIGVASGTSDGLELMEFGSRVPAESSTALPSGFETQQSSLEFEEAEASVEDLATSVVLLGSSATVSQLLQLRLTMQVVPATCLAEFVPEILAAVSKCLNSNTNTEALAAAVLLLRDLLQRIKDAERASVEALLPDLFRGLVSCSSNGSAEVQRIADAALSELLGSLQGPTGLKSLADLFRREAKSMEDASAATCALKTATTLVKSISSADVKHLQVTEGSGLVDELAKLSHHQNAHVRRCVVESFVALQQVLGGNFLDQIQPLLATTQFKLVRIFAGIS